MNCTEFEGCAVLEDFVKDYLIECQEGLTQIESDLLALEKDPRSKSVLSSIFRVVHSIKGSSGFLGFPQMAAVAHEGEELLGKLREGELETTPAIVNGLLALVDSIRSILSSIETTQVEGDRDDSLLIARLRALQSPVSLSTLPATPDIALNLNDVLKSDAEPEKLVAPRRAKSSGVSRSRRSSSDKLVEVSVGTIPKLNSESEVASSASSLSDLTIRVDVAVLDKLMNLVGELVLTRNQMLRCSIVRDEAMFQTSSQKLNLITTELQEAMMKTRMQPIRNLSSKLPRVVRDLASACGKQATILMEGEETELDKTLSEAIKDPITHIIRNAIDHGIEAAEVRVKRGKSPQGTIRLRAYHEGGMVNIELTDDGNGIDPERIRRKALERGWLSSEQAAQWSDRELLGLIFRPGFSTAESLTMVSGRGVGMDVVKSRIESIGGSVDATSQVGIGTTIKMKIPLTLTIINALIVSANGDRFAIPQVNLVELIRLKGESFTSGLVEIQGTWVGRYRGRLLPLVNLNEVLNIGRSEALKSQDHVNIVVLHADQDRFGLVVDLIDDAQEIVVRPLSRQLKGISCLAGATIMGDGKIALILDVFGLAKGLDGSRDRSRGPIGRDDTTADRFGETSESFILLQGTDASPFAIPLADVDRLETFAFKRVEWIADKPLVQYRNHLLPLIDVSAWLKGETWLKNMSEDRNCQVVIHTRGAKQFGFVFDRVIDIVQQGLEIQGDSKRVGVKRTAAIQGRATELLDLSVICEHNDAHAQSREV